MSDDDQGDLHESRREKGRTAIAALERHAAGDIPTPEKSISFILAALLAQHEALTATWLTILRLHPNLFHDHEMMAVRESILKSAEMVAAAGVSILSPAGEKP